MSKYKAVRTECAGIVFDSKKEASRYADLLLLCRVGAISGLELQPKYPVHVTDPRGAKIAVFTYVADFRYTDQDGRVTVEDVKGMKAGAAYSMFKLKKKCVELEYGIRILET